MTLIEMNQQVTLWLPSQDRSNRDCVPLTIDDAVIVQHSHSYLDRQVIGTDGWYLYHAVTDSDGDWCLPTVINIDQELTKDDVDRLSDALKINVDALLLNW
jgi:hypothetical protein